MEMDNQYSSAMFVTHYSLWEKEIEQADRADRNRELKWFLIFYFTFPILSLKTSFGSFNHTLHEILLNHWHLYIFIKEPFDDLNPIKDWSLNSYLLTTNQCEQIATYGVLRLKAWDSWVLVRGRRIKFRSSIVLWIADCCQQIHIRMSFCF